MALFATRLKKFLGCRVLELAVSGSESDSTVSALRFSLCVRTISCSRGPTLSRDHSPSVDDVSGSAEE